MNKIKCKKIVTYFCVGLAVLISIHFVCYGSSASSDSVRPTVKSFEALNNDTDNLHNLELKIKFTHPMEKESVEQAMMMFLSGDLSLSFTSRWEDNYTVFFKPVSSLEKEKTLRIIIGHTARNTSGMEMGENYTRYMVTSLSKPKIIGTEPNDRFGSHPIERAIKIYFSQAMDQYSTGKAFRLVRKDGNGVILGEISWIEGSTCLLFKPDSPLENGTWYVGTLAIAARDIFSQPILNDYTFEFQTN